MDVQICRHYQSANCSKECRKGIKYADVTPRPWELLGIHYRLPCYLRSERAVAELTEGQRASYAERGMCQHFDPLTEEEERQAEQAIQERFDRILRHEAFFQEIKREHFRQDWSGTVKCPECGGTLSVIHYARNGHIHASCSSDGCINFME